VKDIPVQTVISQAQTKKGAAEAPSQIQSLRT
jgi:hypothetical protein